MPLLVDSQRGDVDFNHSCRILVIFFPRGAGWARWLDRIHEFVSQWSMWNCGSIRRKCAVCNTTRILHTQGRRRVPYRRWFALPLSVLTASGRWVSCFTDQLSGCHICRHRWHKGFRFNNLMNLRRHQWSPVLPPKHGFETSSRATVARIPAKTVLGCLDFLWKS